MNEQLKSIIYQIKKKKELSGLSDELILDSLEIYLKRNSISLEKISKLSCKDIKIIIKDIRLSLRLLHGRFNYSTKQRTKLLDSKEYVQILKTHASTKERLNYYEKLRETISSLRVSSIIDLGCGLNPLALSDQNYKYYCIDINQDELSLLEDYFKAEDIPGEVILGDIRKLDLDKLPKADLCICFKLLDILKKVKYEVSTSILIKMSCKYFLISFATKTLSGKNKNNKNRLWFERLVEKLGFHYKLFESENEIFYLISKV